MTQHFDSSGKPAVKATVQISRFKRPSKAASSIKQRAASILGSSPKPQQCVFRSNGELHHSFRYLDEADFEQFPELRGAYNAVVVPAGGDPFMQILIKIS